VRKKILQNRKYFYGKNIVFGPRGPADEIE